MPKNNKSVCFEVISLTKQEIEAIKALHQGEATAYQQKLALMVIVNKFSRAQDMLYIPSSFDETAFLNGRGFVGQKILKYINMPIGKLEEKAENDV